ncbi:MAG: MYXO-CTERM sorting domain-containing protein [Byssovorax sp.]
MRILRPLSALSAGLISLLLAGAAGAAEPGQTLRAGRFPFAGITAGQRASRVALEKAAPAVAFEQMRWSSPVDFGPARTVELDSGERVVKLPQVHRGVPVANRGVAVTFGVDSVANLVSSAIEADLPASVTPAITAQQAADVAAARAHMAHDASRALLAIWPTADGAKLVWAIDIAPLQGIPYLPVTLVDAQSGEIVLTYNAVVSIGKAKVYPSNPVKSPGLIDVVLPVGAGETTLQNSLVQSQNCIDKKTVKDISFMGFPVAVHTCDLLQTALPDAGGDFLDAPGMDKDPEDSFSEISMFYHVNRAYDFFRGFDAKLDVNGGMPIPTVSNLRLPQGLSTFDLNKIKDPNLPLDPFQNAFFSPANPIFSTVFGIDGGAMWFGQGPNKDYSYDGDVVYHEFTHSVVNVTLKLVGTPHMDEFGTSYSPGGMNEALADYFSSALTGDPDVGEYATQDFAPGTPFIRSLANPDTCPSAVGGEVHQDATMFSGSLWDARKTLATPADQLEFDKAVFTAMNKSATGDLAYEELAKLVVVALTSSPLGQPVADKLSAAFTARGLLPKCSRVLEYTGKPISGPKDLQNLWFAPGTQTTGVKSAKGWTPGVVQLHDALPAGATNLTVSFTEVAVGGGGLGGGMGTPFTPQVLVRFGKDPVQFKYKPLAAQADDVLMPATKSGGVDEAIIPIPAGATDAYVMVVSKGELDGAYTKMTLTTDSNPIDMSTSTGVGGSSGTTTAATSTTAGAGGGGGGGTDDQTVGGCGCSVPGGEETRTEAALAAIAALGLIASRRRRRG